jgi:hypothetical protein
MTNPFRYTIAVAAVLLAMLVAAPACQCDSEESERPKTNHVVAVGLDEKGTPYKWKPIKTITVRGSETILIEVGDNNVWFLIPDDRFTLLKGGSEWVASKSFTAFKIEKGYAVIRLDECGADAEPEEGIHYSVLVQDVDGKWDYVHGNNPPPGMIVPPRKR